MKQKPKKLIETSGAQAASQNPGAPNQAERQALPNILSDNDFQCKWKRVLKGFWEKEGDLIIHILLLLILVLTESCKH